MSSSTYDLENESYSDDIDENLSVYETMVNDSDDPLAYSDYGNTCSASSSSKSSSSKSITKSKLSKKNKQQVSADEKRLRELEEKYPLVLSEEPDDEQEDIFYVVPSDPQYLLYPADKGIPRKLKTKKGKVYPIIITSEDEENITDKERERYYVIKDKKNDQILLYSKVVLKDDEGNKYPIELEEGSKPTSKQRKRYFITTEAPTYLYYPKVVLYPWQIDPCEKMIATLANTEVVLNCTRMGWGKTFMSIYIAQNLGLDYKIAVVCPAGPAEEMWRRNLLAYGLDVYTIVSYGKIGGKWGSKYNCEQLLTRGERITEGGIRKIDFEVSDQLKEILESDTHPLLLICDEIHHAKNKGSNATKAIRAIIAAMINYDNNFSRAMYLSGTAIDNIQNQAVNYLYLMGVINSPQLYLKRNGIVEMTGAKQIQEFCENLDRENGTNYTTDTIYRLYTNPRTGVYNTRWHMKAPLINKLPEALLKDVIRKHLFFAAVKPKSEDSVDDNIDSNSEKETGKEEKVDYYNNDTANFYLDVTDDDTRRALESNANDIERIVGYDPETREVDKNRMKTLAQISGLVNERQIIKGAILAEYLKKRLNKYKNIKIIITCDYNDAQKVLSKAFKKYNPVIYDGENKSKWKGIGCAKVIEKFNTDPDCRVWIGKTKAMSEAISLHDTIGNSPREMYILPGLSALNIDQVSYRHMREGAKSKSITRLVFVEGQEVEMYIFASIARKSQDMKTMLTDEAKKTKTAISELRSIYQRSIEKGEEEEVIDEIIDE